MPSRKSMYLEQDRLRGLVRFQALRVNLVPLTWGAIDHEGRLNNIA